MNDTELLRSYRETGSEEAFRELVGRHLAMVYAVALRQVRNRVWAEEAAHAVFIALARKAGSLPARTVLVGWLYRATRFAAGKMLRDEQRRSRREREAAVEHLTNFSSEEDTSDLARLAPLLLETLEDLSRKDRDAILLRFIENHSFAEVAAVMGTTEAAAKMRTGRALAKLRRLLEKRGSTIAAATLATGLADSLSAAPSANLAASVAATALGQVAVTASATSLAGAVVWYFVWVKIKTVAAAAAIAVAGVAAIGFLARDTGGLQVNPTDVVQRKGWIVEGRNVSTTLHQGRQAVRFDVQPGAGVAWREGLSFSEGEIEADLAAYAGHIGVAFWIQDSQHYSAVYFRPQNRPEDPIRGGRGVQYVASPEYGWERLRREKGGIYENSASLPPPDSGKWFHVRLEVSRTQVRAFINNSMTPCLVISDVLTTNTTGSVGFYMGDGSPAIISNLKARPARK
jgi:RNA polymerase sigma factor (sigma-70 family)